MEKRITVQTRRELLAALRGRYRASTREEKTRIVEDFVSISGYHRKSAIRILNGLRVGVDIAKSVFHVHAVDRHDQLQWQVRIPMKMTADSAAS